jgi:hypothetical protein
MSPDDFFLFEYPKGKSSDYNCESPLNAITEILTGVDQEVLQAIEFNMGEISTNSVNSSPVEPVRKSHPMESVAGEPEDFVRWGTT